MSNTDAPSVDNLTSQLEKLAADVTTDDTIKGSQDRATQTNQTDDAQFSARRQRLIDDRDKTSRKIDGAWIELRSALRSVPNQLKDVDGVAETLTDEGLVKSYRSIEDKHTTMTEAIRALLTGTASSVDARVFDEVKSKMGGLIGEVNTARDIVKAKDDKEKDDKASLVDALETAITEGGRVISAYDEYRELVKKYGFLEETEESQADKQS